MSQDQPVASAEYLRRIAVLTDEIATLRRRLAVTGPDTAPLKRQLAEAETTVRSLAARNEKLLATLRDARTQLVHLTEEVDRLAQPPSGYGIFLAAAGTQIADVFTGGRKMRVVVAPTVDISALHRGQQVRLNEAMTVVQAGQLDQVGEVVTVKDMIGLDRALVVGHADEEKVVLLTEDLCGQLRGGDSVLVDTKAGVALEQIDKAEVNELVLAEVPDITYQQIGGLGSQIEQIRDAVELPFLHAELFREYQLRPPKGVLLYGPPGCGKTLIAKAVANSLAEQVARRRGMDQGRSYFLNIKGPELLNKFVGETERTIRLIFSKAREMASDGTPVIVFFDEMDAVFRTRGSGVSSDVETTIVPQLLSEIDGVEGLENVIVIGASNREDMIDPAILRPGRLDVKIKIERPDAEAAAEIFGKYLTTTLPLDQADLVEFAGDRHAAIAGMIAATVAQIYAESEENQFLEVTYAGGDREVLYFKDFNSGAMIQNIVDRAKKAAIKGRLAGISDGVSIAHLHQAVLAEFAENEDLPNTTNPDDWARISGKKGERIVYIRTLVSGKQSTGLRSIETSPSMGQYL